MYPRLNKAGVYRIITTSTVGINKFYIGQAKNLRIRFQNHLWALKNRRHKNPAMQSAFDAYGETAFRFEVLIICEQEKETLELFEQKVLDLYLKNEGGHGVYNVLTQCVSARWGMKASPETRAKMSAARRGRKLTPEHIEILRASRVGKKLSAEAIAKRTAKQTGRVVRPETRAKHSAAILGIKRSEETKAKISAAKKGFGPSAEHMEMLRRINTGRKMSPEHVEKLAAMKRGKPRDLEVMKKAWATRRSRAEARCE